MYVLSHLPSEPLDGTVTAVRGLEFDMNVTVLISVHTKVCGGQVLQKITLLVFNT